MTNLSKFVFPLALIVAAGLSGCDSKKAAEAEAAAVAQAEAAQAAAIAEEEAAEAAVIAEAEAAKQTPSETESGSETAADGEESASASNASPVNQMMEKIQEQLAPEKISKTLDEGLEKFTQSIAEITDVTAATEALPKLRAFQQQMAIMNSMSKMVPPESQPIIFEKVSAALGPIEEALEKIYENKKVKAILQPVTNGLMRNLEQVVKKFEPKSDEDDAEGDSEADGDSEAEAEGDDSAEETDAE